MKNSISFVIYSAQHIYYVISLLSIDNYVRVLKKLQLQIFFEQLIINNIIILHVLYRYIMFNCILLKGIIMARIKKLTIKNFRGIKDFSQSFSETNFICLVGRGDSGKSTILKAISIALSPYWNIPIYDTDFFETNTDENIEIEVCLDHLHPQILSEDKFGLLLKLPDGIDNDNDQDDETRDRISLTIRFTVDKTLEPKWIAINEINDAEKTISANEREKLNAHFISDYMDRHFSLSKGSLLYSIIKKDEDFNSSNETLDILRDAKQNIDQLFESKYKNTINEIKEFASVLGLDLQNLMATMDVKDLISRDEKVCLHDDKIPLWRLGKGSKRLASIAIQLLQDESGIILIDEIEQGLEPDRIRSIVSYLKKQDNIQVFLTTHSKDVIIELDSTDIHKMVRGKDHLYNFKISDQAAVRANPQALFANKIIICEGETEFGICKALNDYRIKKYLPNLAHLGIVLVIGKGDSLFNYSQSFLNANYKVCIFMDSDKNDNINKKEEQYRQGVEIIDWEEGQSVEDAIIKYLPLNSIKILVDDIPRLYANKGHMELNSAQNKLQQSFQDMSTDFNLFDLPDIELGEQQKKDI